MVKLNDYIDYLFPASFLALLAFVQCNNLWMGDGYQIQHFVESSNYVVYPFIYSMFFIAPIAHLIAHSIGFYVMAYVCGLVYFLYAWRLFEEDRKYSILFVLPIIQVFAGYIETYAPFYTATLITYYYRIREDRTKMLAAGMITFFCHFVMGFPIALYAAYKYYRSRGLKSTIPYALVIIGYVVLMTQCNLQRGPFLYALWGYYSLFSYGHLAELLGLFAFNFIWIMPYLNKIYWRSDYVYPAALSVLMTILLVPHLGMLRDWDLFSMAALPVTFLILYSVKAISWRVKVIMLLITGAFMMFNNSNPQKTMFKYFETAPQYSPDFMGGNLLQATAIIIQNELGDTVSAYRMVGLNWPLTKEDSVKIESAFDTGENK